MEHNCGQGLAPDSLNGPFPGTGLEHPDLELQARRDAAAHSLDGTLGLLESLGTRIAHYAILRDSLAPPSPECPVDGAALAWIQTSLEDIGATLRGIAADAREAE